VPVPRRFDRRPPERDSTRVNERIRVPEVRVIGDDGTQIGVMRTDEALRYAQERDLDLVEVAPEARPPVCRVLDYSKYKYEQSQKQKAARKHQQQITIREIKFRPKIAEQDYATKKRHVERFLKHKDKVKITIMFRGREVTHPERGQMILDRLAEELTELAIIEQRPNLDGRNMTMLLGPSKAVLAGTLGAEGENGADPSAESDGEADASMATAELEPVASDDAEPVAEDDAEPVAADDAEPVAADDAEPVAADDAEPVAADDAEPVAADDAEPVAADDAEPVAADDAEPVAEDDAAPVAADDAEPAA
jgi:translation initiation factor IF-3